MRAKSFMGQISKKIFSRTAAIYVQAKFQIDHAITAIIILQLWAYETMPVNIMQNCLTAKWW